MLPLGEIRATFIVAMIWALWHLPILLIGLNYPDQTLSTVLPVFAIAVVLMAFPFTWLYVKSRSSVMVVAVMHAVLNATGDTFTSSKYLRGNPLIVSAGGLVAGAILLVAGRRVRGTPIRGYWKRIDPRLDSQARVGPAEG